MYSCISQYIGQTISSYILYHYMSRDNSYNNNNNNNKYNIYIYIYIYIHAYTIMLSSLRSLRNALRKLKSPRGWAHFRRWNVRQLAVANRVTLTLTKAPYSESDAANVEWHPLHADVPLLIKELSLGLDVYIYIYIYISSLCVYTYNYIGIYIYI